VNGSKLQDMRSHDAQSTVQHLVERAVRGLPQMFNPRAGMFCHKLKKAAGGLVQEGVSPRYTAMTLLGLHRLEQSGTPSPVNVRAVLDRLLANTGWADNIGDLGLLLWLCAHVAPHGLDELERRLPISTALSRFADVRNGMTMHLAWFLTGLSYCSLVSGNPEKMRKLARETYDLLIQNQGKFGYFGHLATHRSLKGSVRGRIGSFADQVYPIYGMTQFSRAYGDDSALRRARECALAICESQGALGQWWWHYDSRGGRVFEEYPVFSVHQHGMGPMTLFALSKASEMDFDPWIYKGLEWINRRNELSVDMGDASANVIWRCVRQSARSRFASNFLPARRNGQHPGPTELSVLFECRPYELGWLLYGLVDALPKPVSVARQSDVSSSVS
jgi:hypothetical protein